MKWLALAMIFLACTGTGLQWSRKSACKVHTVEKILLMISIIENELSYRCLPLRELFGELSTREDLKGLTFLREWDGEETFTDYWEHSLRGYTIDPVCDGYLRSFGSMLGTTDLDGQVNLCRHYRCLFEEALAQAREKKEKYAKLYTSLGCMAGVAAVVLLV